MSEISFARIGDFLEPLENRYPTVTDPDPIANTEMFSTIANEIARLRQLIISVAPLLSSYGDGGVIYPDEAQIIAAVQQEARRG